MHCARAVPAISDKNFRVNISRPVCDPLFNEEVGGKNPLFNNPEFLVCAPKHPRSKSLHLPRLLSWRRRIPPHTTLHDY